MGKEYTVSDGKMMLVLSEAEEGGFVVTSPLDPGLVTQAESLQEAFLMAYDAAECLTLGRRILAERLSAISQPEAESKVKPSIDHGVTKSSKKTSSNKKRGRALGS